MLCESGDCTDAFGYNRAMGEYITNTVCELRTKKGITQEELAEAVGVTRQTIISIEKGRYAPSVTLALKIAGVFKARVEDIFSIRYE